MSRPDVKGPTVVSLFAGLGGSSLGYKQAGFDVRLAVEWEDHAVATYRKNFPGTKVLQAVVRKLSGDAALAAAGLRRGELDVMDGSPPCQGFSASGYGDPGDSRNNLFKEYLRLLRAFNPRALVMENVKGLLHGKHRPVLRAIIEGMESAGYIVDVQVLSAAWFGIPQDRRRVIFIGARKDLGVRPEVNPPRGKTPTIIECLRGCPPDEKRWLKGTTLRLWLKTKPGHNLGDAHPQGSFFSNQKLHPFGRCPTICASLPTEHWKEPRFLTIAEGKRLQGLPDEFVLEGSYGARWARIGNSVPPPMMKAIALHVRKTILGRGNAKRKKAVR